MGGGGGGGTHHVHVSSVDAGWFDFPDLWGAAAAGGGACPAKCKRHRCGCLGIRSLFVAGGLVPLQTTRHSHHRPVRPEWCYDGHTCSGFGWRSVTGYEVLFPAGGDTAHLSCDGPGEGIAAVNVSLDFATTSISHRPGATYGTGLLRRSTNITPSAGQAGAAMRGNVVYGAALHSHRPQSCLWRR